MLEELRHEPSCPLLRRASRGGPKSTLSARAIVLLAHPPCPRCCVQIAQLPQRAEHAGVVRCAADAWLAITRDTDLRRERSWCRGADPLARPESEPRRAQVDDSSPLLAVRQPVANLLENRPAISGSRPRHAPAHRTD